MHLRAFLLSVLVLTQIFLGALATQSVLCIEPDGGVRVEHDGSLCCDQEEAPLSVGGPLVAADCCSCIDVAMPSERDRSVVKTSKPVMLAPCVLPTAWRIWSTVATSVIGLQGSFIGQPPSGPPPSPTVLRC